MNTQQRKPRALSYTEMMNHGISCLPTTGGELDEALVVQKSSYGWKEQGSSAGIEVPLPPGSRDG